MAEVPHDEREHSLRSPSKAGIYTRCPGAPRLWARVGEGGSSEAARLGTAKHTLAQTVMETGIDAKDFLGEVIKVEGSNYTVDDDFAADVQKAVEMVWEVIGPDDGKMLLEVRVPIDHIVGPGETGNADLLYISWERKRAFVIDHKFGRKVVKAANNPSLLLYAAGAIRYAGLWEQIEDWDFTLAITQPVQGSPSIWELTGKEMNDELTKLKGQCAETYKDDAPFAVGDHCFFCAGKPICPEMAIKVGSMVFDDPDFDNIDQKTDISELTPEAAAKVLPSLNAVEQWIKDFREHWKQQWISGTDIPGWKVVPGKNGARNWTDRKAVEDLMANKFRLPAKEMYSQNVITPAAAEKLLAEASPRRWKQLEGLIKQAQQAPSLVPEDSPAPPMERTSDDCPFI